MNGLVLIGNVAALLMALCTGEAAAAPFQRLEVSPGQRELPSRSDAVAVRADPRTQLTKAEGMVKQATTAIKAKDLQLAMEAIRTAAKLVQSVVGSGVVSADLTNALSGVESAINSGDDAGALTQCGVARDGLKDALQRLPKNQ